MGDAIHDLKEDAGNINYFYNDVVEYVTQDVKVRATSQDSFFFVYYDTMYYETAPPAALGAMNLDQKYVLTITEPYFTMLAMSDGGSSSFTVEYGRIDERAYGTGEGERSRGQGLVVGLAVLVMSLLIN